MSSVRVHSCVFGFTQHQRGVVWVLASEVYAQEVKINITLFKSEMFGHLYKSQSTCSKVPVTFETHAIHIRLCIFHMRNMFIHVWCINPTGLEMPTSIDGNRKNKLTTGIGKLLSIYSTFSVALCEVDPHHFFCLLE